MALIKEWEKELFKQTQEGRLFLEYNELTGGEPIGLFVPDGYPKGVEEMGGVSAVYRACIEKGVTWEELLNLPQEDIRIDY